MISTRRLTPYLTALALLLVLPTAQPLVPSGAAEAEVRAAVQGAPGIGDDYFPLDGNGGIDVLRYRIHDSYRFGDRHLRGRTRITLRATQDLTTFNLDFLLPVHSVTVEGRHAVYDQASQRHELVIEPQRSLKAGEKVDVVVGYGGFPERYSYLGESNWLASDREVVAMNEPHMAPWWFPANDHPQDKALVDIAITVPRGNRVIANGRQVSRHDHARTSTFRWVADEPMVPYLAFFAAGRFAVDRGRHDGLPWLVAVSRSLSPNVRRGSMRMLRKTPAIVSWLASQVGDYPFSVSGGLVTSLSPGFALENQTRPTYQALGSGQTDLLVHELAHQWFGDSVAVREWRDIWLNEGFATFMSVRYDETRGGQGAQEWLEAQWEVFDSSWWQLPIGDPGSGAVFAGQVYERGAMTLQALRHLVGETAFWTILRTWVADREGGNGAIDDFTALTEQVSGLDLDAFFETWLFAPERPAHTAANGF